MQQRRRIGIAVECDQDGAARCLGMREASLCMGSKTSDNPVLIAESPPPYMNDAALKTMRALALSQALDQAHDQQGQMMVEFDADDVGDFTLIGAQALSAHDAALITAARKGWAVLAWVRALGGHDHGSLQSIIWPDSARLDHFARVDNAPVDNSSIRLLSWGARPRRGRGRYAL